MYDDYRRKYGDNAYRRISQLLTEAKDMHKKDWEKDPTPEKDHEQSWRAFKGKNLEKLIEYMIRNEIENSGLRVANGNRLERSSSLPPILATVKENLTINYEGYGPYLPDVDLVIYHPSSGEVIAVISSKVTLRERVAQTGYWKLKLLSDKRTEHIKVYFVTPDEDETLMLKDPMKKGRAIVECDLDGSYVLSEENIEESDKVKLFEHFIDDLKGIANGTP